MEPVEQNCKILLTAARFDNYTKGAVTKKNMYINHLCARGQSSGLGLLLLLPPPLSVVQLTHEHLKVRFFRFNVMQHLFAAVAAIGRFGLM